MLVWMEGAGDFTLIENAIARQLEARVSYLRGKVFGAVDAVLLAKILSQPAPAAIVFLRDQSEAYGTGRLGLPVARDYTLLWDVFLIATSFSPSGEGRQTGPPMGAVGFPAGPGVGQMVRDCFSALVGYKADPEGGYDGARLMYLGNARDQILNGKLVWRSRWRHSVRWTGSIAS